MRCVAVGMARLVGHECLHVYVCDFMFVGPVCLCMCVFFCVVICAILQDRYVTKTSGSERQTIYIYIYICWWMMAMYRCTIWTIRVGRELRRPRQLAERWTKCGRPSRYLQIRKRGSLMRMNASKQVCYPLTHRYSLVNWRVRRRRRWAIVVCDASRLMGEKVAKSHLEWIYKNIYNIR